MATEKKEMGIYLSDNDHDCLTNLRFADDVLLLASSKEQIRKMLCEFSKSTEKVGLRIHPEKTKILSNQSIINSDKKKELEVEDMKIEILTRNESVKYLGQNRKCGPELASKNYTLKHRLRLFDAAISPTICYAAGTEHDKMIQSTQHKMLRFIIQKGHRSGRCWTRKYQGRSTCGHGIGTCADTE